MLMLNKVTYLGNTSLSEKIAFNYFNTHSMATWQKWQNWGSAKVNRVYGAFTSLEPETANLILTGVCLEGNKKIQLTALKPLVSW